ncbi:uncharacterized protein LOC130719652 [Lotus japonicus]|uniref:uncharacterized protein LOC130719652 n=1 Tax=Lotus japonicus TaxID=34305 RepID=UPI002585BB38|nr:uncharacterized protein LOC130719652 [Lotus japonicus]
MGGPTNRWDGGSHSLGREESSLHTRSASHGRSEPSFGSSNSRRRMVKVCGCGVEAPLLTSWTGDNPERRFYGCGLFKVHGRRLCSFFEWYDDVGNAREKKVIALLSRKNAEMKKTIKVLVCCLIFAMIMIMALIFAYVSK